MTRFIVDASVALKWLIADEGSDEAASLRWATALLAPDLIVPEVSNALWKAARRGELSQDQAMLAARLLERADMELRPMRALLARATELALRLDHPAYDCIYLALAEAEGCALVTADERLARKVATTPIDGVEVLTLGAAAAKVARL